MRSPSPRSPSLACAAAIIVTACFGTGVRATPGSHSVEFGWSQLSRVQSKRASFLRYFSIYELSRKSRILLKLSVSCATTPDSRASKAAPVCCRGHETVCRFPILKMPSGRCNNRVVQRNAQRLPRKIGQRQWIDQVHFQPASIIHKVCAKLCCSARLSIVGGMLHLGFDRSRLAFLKSLHLFCAQVIYSLPSLSLKELSLQVTVATGGNEQKRWPNSHTPRSPSSPLLSLARWSS